MNKFCSFRLGDLVKRDDKDKLLAILHDKDRKPCQKDINNALLTAAELGRNSMLLELLDAGANINVVDSSGCPPVLLAALNNHVETVRTLLEHPKCSSTLRVDLRKRTALHHAVATNNMELLELLLEKGADVNAISECNETPLLVAISYNHQDMIKRLLREPSVKLSMENIHGRTVLHKAVELGDLDLVKLLLQHNVEVGVVNSSWESPLHLACESGNVEICQELLKNGALIEAPSRTYPSMTPLMTAVAKGTSA